jgi:hypothetical protein
VGAPGHSAPIFLIQHNSELTFLSKEEIEAKYPFSRDAAIYSYAIAIEDDCKGDC